MLSPTVLNNHHYSNKILIDFFFFYCTGFFLMQVQAEMFSIGMKYNKKLLQVESLKSNLRV